MSGYLLVEQPECRHTKHPQGYLAHAEWADRKMKTHRQERCPVCGLWAVWKPKKRAANSQEVHA